MTTESVQPASSWNTLLPGFADLRQLSAGDPRVHIAILDGPIGPPQGPLSPAAEAAMRHGAAIASVISGSSDGLVVGLAPGCAATVTNIYADPAGAEPTPKCSHEKLAGHIREAVAAGAHIINISAAQPLDRALAPTELVAALAEAERRDVLVVASAGNDGCACDALPASVPSVLAVGAHDASGRPLPISNWGAGARGQGILAPGAGVPGACLEGGICSFNGTSFASAIVTGVAALLMSGDIVEGIPPSGSRIRRILKESADACDPTAHENCGPFLLGRLNIRQALKMRGDHPSPGERERVMVETEVHVTCATSGATALAPTGASLTESRVATDRMDGVTPACGCGGKCGGKCGDAGGCSCGDKAKPQLAYAIGRVDVSFVSLARRDSLWRAINGGREDALKPISDAALLDLFTKQPFQAQSVVWTLSRTEVPMYAIIPSGAFAAETYRWLVEEWADADVEFASVPGVVAGQTTLYDGSIVDVLVPDLRGMHSWSVSAYTKAIVDERKKAEPKLSETALKQDISRFFGKILFSIRNKGITASERALNAAATNAFNFSDVLREAGREGMTLRDVAVERSPINRIGGEYYDVLLTFFDPKRRIEAAALLARFTIDVADTVPVLIGEPTIWYEY